MMMISLCLVVFLLSSVTAFQRLSLTRINAANSIKVQRNLFNENAPTVVEVPVPKVVVEGEGTVMEVTEVVDVDAVVEAEAEDKPDFDASSVGDLLQKGLTLGLYGYIAYLFIDSVRILVMGASGPPPV